MIFYILLTHGPKPTGTIRGHPAARTQLALFDRIIEQYPKIKHQFVCDYARRIEGLAALPDLRRHLVVLKEMGDGEIIADSLSRLVRKVAFDQRTKFISELGEYGRHLFLLSHKKKLSNFSQSEITDMIFHAEKFGSPAKQRRNRDTEDARTASLESRQRLRDRIRQRLEELRGELRGTQGHVTLQMIADRANALGMRTATGKEWTRQTVGRALEGKVQISTE